MRRPIWLRALVGLWSLWFTAALLEAPGIHTCAVHSGHAAHGQAAASPNAAMHMASHGHATTPGAPTHDAASCTCLGVCCGAVPVLTPAASIEFTAPTSIAPAPRIAYVATAPAIIRRYARPFANGPPTSA